MIRAMKKEDLSSIKTLMQPIPNFWHGVWNNDTLERAFYASNDLAFVFVDDREVIAFIFCYDLGFRAYLGEFAVAENKRGLDIGKKLLSHVENILKQRGCELIISDVWKSAEPFYRKQGWKEPQALLLGKRLIKQ